jgi:hypothetical protein
MLVKKIPIYDEYGETSYHVMAEINEHGWLRIASNDSKDGVIVLDSEEMKSLYEGLKKHYEEK